MLPTQKRYFPATRLSDPPPDYRRRIGAAGTSWYSLARELGHNEVLVGLYLGGLFPVAPILQSIDEFNFWENERYAAGHFLQRRFYAVRIDVVEAFGTI